MVSSFPVQTWGRMISPNEDEMPAQLFGDTPASISITMAALDPGEEWNNNAGVDEFKGKKPRATIKMIVYPAMDSDEEDDDSDDDETDPNLAALLDEDDSDEDGNGEGPSDPNKSPKARLAQELLGHEKKPAVNGVAKKNKGKAKATLGEEAASEEDDDEDEELDSDDMEMNDFPEEYVLCTLDPDSHYQQPLNLVISANENVFFRVEGTHSIHLTGNYLADDAFGGNDYDSDEFDYPPGEDEEVDLPSDLEIDEDDDDIDEGESDELDDTADPRITELPDEDEAPALVKATQKGANKRAAAEEDSDAEMADADAKPLSKSQAKKMHKKLKDNAGNALDIAAATSTLPNGTSVTDAAADLKSAKGDKKVQFAKTLVQGPSTTDATKTDSKADPAASDKKKPSLGVKTVQGVTLDDKKLGSGPAAKNGSRVSMRYIGKLASTKRVFDSNKKGAPFAFKLGAGQVIRGWEIGVQGMQAGGERRITIPAHLAYGSKKMGDIPPNSELVFDLKVVEIK